jgi:hypothetical protein
VDQAIGLPEVAEKEARLDLPEGDADEVGEVQGGGYLFLIGVKGARLPSS